MQRCFCSIRLRINGNGYCGYMKNVLVIAYYFPPTGGGGVQRVTKFVKYLPSFGWRPVVLTVKNPDFDIFDESLMEDIDEDVKVYRTYSFDPIRWYRVKRYGPGSRFEPIGRELVPGNRRLLTRVLFSPARMLFKCIRYVLNNLLLVPDDYIGWIPFAVFKGLRVIRKEKIDVIYATGKPWSAFLIALFLKLLTGRPYVLDLRDPWTITPYGNSEGIKQMLERFWEKTCFSYAKKVININEQITNSYIKYYPKIPPNKFAFITHGFDPMDFTNVRGINSKDEFIVSYVGTLYSNTSPDNVLRSVSSLVHDKPDLKNGMRLKFVGFVPDHVRRMIKDLGLEGIVETAGYFPHRESIQHMLASDALLLLLNNSGPSNNAQVSTGKLFEYLASRRPILAVIPKDTDAAKLINEAGAGRVVDPDDVREIEKNIYEMYVDYKNGGLKAHTADLDRFDRKNLTRNLADILNAVQPESS